MSDTFDGMVFGNSISTDTWDLAGKNSYYEINGYPDGTVKIVGKVVNGKRVELSEDEKNNIPLYGGQINKVDTGGKKP